ncbi:MAG: Fe-S cluster assembly scaffold IscU [Myxococcota bacterium]
MQYSQKLLEICQNPKNVGTLDKSDENVGTGVVGSPACGDVMQLQIKVDENGIITDAKFKTFGCGSAIASASVITERIIGKHIDEALKVSNREIAEYLELPPIKYHCSVLAEESIQAALNDWRNKRGLPPVSGTRETNAEMG